MALSDEQVQSLIEEAARVKENSYSPYSRFRVGVAVLGNDEKIYTGTNVENASYGLTLCAERVAISQAISQGSGGIAAVVVVTDLHTLKWCCGACCGFILEFGENIPIYSVSSDRSLIESKTIRELAPFSFSKADLPAPLYS